MPASRRKNGPRQRTTTEPRSPDRPGDDGNHRFSREHRLGDASAYRDVFADARRSRDALFTVLYRPRSRGPARLGLAIAKKHCKLASGRNRIKRLVRESFRRNKHRLNGMDLVVMNNRAAADATNKAIFESLEKHWVRVAAARQASDG